MVFPYKLCNTIIVLQIIHYFYYVLHFVLLRVNTTYEMRTLIFNTLICDKLIN